MSTAHPCPKELTVQKEGFSPGKVENDESIIYVIIHPIQWQNGSLSNAAFSKSQLMRGELSVSREMYSSKEKLYQCVIKPQLERDNNRRLIGTMKCKCSDIRSIKHRPTNVRAICVIDDGNENDPSHAHLSFSDSVKNLRKNDLVAIRGNLKIAFGDNKVLTLEETFRSRLTTEPSETSTLSNRQLGRRPSSCLKVCAKVLRWFMTTSRNSDSR